MRKVSVLFLMIISSTSTIRAQFGLNTTLFSIKPVTAKVTYEKDGVEVGDLFKVFYEKEKSNGSTKDVKVGYVMAHKIGSSTIKNNKTSKVYDGNSPLTVFKKVGVRNVEKGMEIKKAKRNFISYGAEYSLQDNTFFSGPTVLATFKGATGSISFVVATNLKFSTNTPITYNGITKDYDIKSWGSIGLRGEKILAFLNYFQVSGVAGFFGVPLFVDNIGKTTNNTEYASGMIAPWYVYGGLKLSFNINPRLQFYVQDLYTANLVSGKWDMSYYGGAASTTSVESQLKDNLKFQANSINFGIRIR
jgi:hypothetical protein